MGLVEILKRVFASGMMEFVSEVEVVIHTTSGPLMETVYATDGPPIPLAEGTNPSPHPVPLVKGTSRAGRFNRLTHFTADGSPVEGTGLIGRWVYGFTARIN